MAPVQQGFGLGDDPPGARDGFLARRRDDDTALVAVDEPGGERRLELLDRAGER